VSSKDKRDHNNCRWSNTATGSVVCISWFYISRDQRVWNGHKENTWHGKKCSAIAMKYLEVSGYY